MVDTVRLSNQRQLMLLVSGTPVSLYSTVCFGRISHPSLTAILGLLLLVGIFVRLASCN
jgi:hypothetical protein